MKRLVIQLLGLSLAWLTTGGVLAQTGPVSYWRFDEAPGSTIALDSTGFASGTLSPTGAGFVPAGVLGNALSLSRAQGGLVNMGNVHGFPFLRFSISVWVRTNPGDTTDNLVVVSKHQTGTRNGYFVNVNTTGGALTSNHVHFVLGGSGAAAPTTAETPSSTSVVNDGQWHHVVAVHDLTAFNKRIYVDGVPAEETAAFVSYLQNTAPFLVGGVTVGATPTALFDGFLDELQVYDRALSDVEIDNLYQTQGASLLAPPNETGNRVLAVAVQADGKIVAGGAFNSLNGAGVTNLTRLISTSSLDGNFFNGVGASDLVNEVLVQADGRMLVGGNFLSLNTLSLPRIARLNANGTPDPGFRPGLGADGAVTALAVQANGKILVGGAFTNFGGLTRRGLARLNADGSPDTTFVVPGGIGGDVTDVAALAGGGILVGGNFTNAAGAPVPGLVKLLSDGSRDTNFNAAFTGTVQAMALATNGQLYVAGLLTAGTNGGTLRRELVRLNANGSVDPAYGATVGDAFGFDVAGVRSAPRTLQLCSDGSLIAGGLFTQVHGDNTRARLVRLLPDGSLDTAFLPAGNPNAGVYSLAMLPNDTVVVGGSFSRLNGTNYDHVATVQCTTNSGGGTPVGPVTIVQGTVRNALNGQVLPGVLVQAGGLSGISAANGVYSIANVPVGPQIITAQLTGFDTTTNAATLLQVPVNTLAFNLSPSITDSNTIRIVLTWGQDPRDLDSHLRTPIPGFFTDHVYFGNRGSLTAPPFASLDVDVVSGFGPETITVTNRVPGIYSYYIHHFSGSSTIGASGAQVQVFGAGGLLGVITPPANLTDRYWHVLQFDGASGGFAIINQGSVNEPINAISNLTYTAIGAGGGSGVAASIVAQPQDTVVLAGGTATLSVAASGAQPLAYQWLRNGAPVPGANSSVLTISGATVLNSGSYEVRVSNSQGAVLSRQVSLTVLSTTTPFVYGNPTSRAVPQGSSTTFSVLAGGGQPLNYQWRREGVAIPGANGPVLNLPNVQPADAGKYSVVIVSSFGLAVSTAADLLVQTAPVIQTQPSGSTVNAGETAIFSVAQSGLAPFFYQWFRDGIAVPGANGSTLTYLAAHFTNAGTYTVVVSNAIGTATSQGAVLTVLSPPILLSEPANRSVTAGGLVQLDAQVAGTAPLVFQWRRDGTNVPGGNAAQLVFSNTQPFHAGGYLLVATNNFGAVTSRVAQLQVVPAHAFIPWATDVGGTGSDVGRGVAADAAGNTVLVGSFSGTATFGTNVLVSAGLDDVFIVKLNPAGSVLWARRAGGPGFDSANAVAVDAAGNIHVTGAYEGIAAFSGVNLTNANATTYADLFVARYDGAGNLLWVRSEGAAFAHDLGHGIAVDVAGSVYVAGESSLDTFGGVAVTNLGRILLAKYDAGGIRLWARKAGSFNGGNFDAGRAVVVSPAGPVFVAGSFRSPQLSVAATLTNQGNADIFLASYDSAGQLNWARNYGGPGDDSAHGLGVDGTGNIYVAGEFAGTVTLGTNTVTSSGGSLADALVAKFDSNGNNLWAQALGGGGTDSARGLAVDAAGNAFVTGFFSGVAGFGTNSLASVANTVDMFTAQLDPAGNVQFAQQAGGDDLNGDFGYGVAVDPAGNATFTGSFRGSATAGGVTRQSTGAEDVLVIRLTPPSPLPPNLTAVVSGGQLILSWPVSSPGFLLQRRTGLGGGNWVDDLVAPVVVGDRFYLTNAIGTNVQFFQLRRP